MGKNTRISRATVTGKFVTKPIGSRKATKFAAVEGLKISRESREISRNAASRGLQGDAYRTEITRSFKKS